MPIQDRLSVEGSYGSLQYELREYQSQGDIQAMDAYLFMPNAMEVPVPGMLEQFIKVSPVSTDNKYTLRSTGCLLQGVVGRCRDSGTWLSMMSHSSLLCMRNRQGIREQLSKALRTCRKQMAPGTIASFFAGSSTFIDITGLTTYAHFVETFADEVERELGVPSQVLAPPKVLPHTCSHLYVHTAEPRAVVRQSEQGLPPALLHPFQVADVRKRLAEILAVIGELQW